VACRELRHPPDLHGADLRLAGLLKLPGAKLSYRYEGLQALLTAVAEKVIAPAERKVNALQERRRMIEAELTKPQ
jgi:hypothetical protein